MDRTDGKLAGIVREGGFPLESARTWVRRFARPWMGFLLLTADLCGLALALKVTGYLDGSLFEFMLPAWNPRYEHWLLLLFFPLLYMVFGLYPGVGLSPVSEMRSLARATTSGFVIMILTNLLWGATMADFRLSLLIEWVLSLVFIQLARWLVRIAAVYLDAWGEPVAVLGWGRDSGWAVDYLLKRKRLGLVPVAFVDLAAPDATSRQADHFARNGIKTAVVVKGMLEEFGFQKAIEDTGLEFFRYILIPQVRRVGSFGVVLHDLEGMFGMELRDNLADPYTQAMKRLLDIAVVLVGGLLVLPLGVLFALWIAWDSRGGVFYSHGRIGKNGRRINVLKFRSMVKNAEGLLSRHLEQNEPARREWEESRKLRADPRITRAGRLLRRTSLDELPQIWNVLKGEMSLVGPRPVTEEELKRYGEGARQYLRVRPGMTGLWQVSGRNNTTYAERVQLDEYYARNWSIWLDMYILARTLWVVLRRKGAY